MCTGLTYLTKDDVHLLTRTMDFSFQFDAVPTFIPQNHHFDSLVNKQVFFGNYAFFGVCHDMDGYIFTDGFNEKGFESCAHVSRASQYSLLDACR